MIHRLGFMRYHTQNIAGVLLALLLLSGLLVAFMPQQAHAACSRISMKANPTKIASGETSVVSWSIGGTNAQIVTSVTLNGSPVGVSGQISVTPQVPTRYTVAASFSDGVSDSCSVAIAVDGEAVEGNPSPFPTYDPHFDVDSEDTWIKEWDLMQRKATMQSDMHGRVMEVSMRNEVLGPEAGGGSQWPVFLVRDLSGNIVAGAVGDDDRMTQKFVFSDDGRYPEGIPVERVDGVLRSEYQILRTGVKYEFEGVAFENDPPYTQNQLEGILEFVIATGDLPEGVDIPSESPYFTMVLFNRGVIQPDGTLCREDCSPAVGSIDPGPSAGGGTTVGSVGSPVVDVTPPSQPIILGGYTTDELVVFNWSKSADDTFVAKYEVYRDGVYAGETLGGQTFVDQSNLVAGASYSYTVVAVDISGNKSVASAAKEFTLPGALIGAKVAPDPADNEPPVILPASDEPLTVTAGISYDVVAYRAYTCLDNKDALITIPSFSADKSIPNTANPGDVFDINLTCVDSDGNQVFEQASVSVVSAADAEPSEPIGDNSPIDDGNSDGVDDDVLDDWVPGGGNQDASGDTGDGTSVDPIVLAEANQPDLGVKNVGYGGLVPCEGVGCSACDFVKLGGNIFDWLVRVLSVLATIIIVAAGLRLVLSGGNVAAKMQARRLFSKAAIGLILVLGAWILVDLFMRVLLVSGEGDFGSWADVQCGMQTAAETAPDEPTVLGVVNGVSTPVGDAALAGDGLGEEAARAILDQYGVLVKSEADSAATLTGVRQHVLDGVGLLNQDLLAACPDCRPITITEATGGTHNSGTFSHEEGFKLDLRTRDNPGLVKYITETYQPAGSWKDGTQLYYDPASCGTYALESDHVDVVYKTGCVGG